MRYFSLAAATVLLAGCAAAPNSLPATTTAATPTVTTSETTAPEPTATPTAVQVRPTPSSTMVAAPPQQPPPAPTAPAPSTAGGLGATDVAQADGWEPIARAGSPDEGFMGNGTWVHATSAEHSAFAAISLGCTELGPYPMPVAALEGNLTDGGGRPGVGLTLEFSSAEDAQAYFAEWLRQAEACLGTATQKLTASADTWVGRRILATTWSETAGVRDDTVRFLIVESPDADLSGALNGAR